MFSIFDDEKLAELLETHNQPRYKIDQIHRSVYKDLYTDFDLFTTISKDLRQILKENCYFWSLNLESCDTSKNGQTTKFIFTTYDNERFETVIMRHLTGRNTICVSSQVGCAMACSFCATGKIGIKRNLTSSEIVEQFMWVIQHLHKEGAVLRNAVYMGMGEPFLNYPEVKKSLQIVLDQKHINLSNRRVTISTCGIVPGIREFTKDFPQTSLAISLHAPTDEGRKTIMPVNHTYPLVELMSALDDYVEKTNNRIFYEYIMIAGVTDKLEYAYKLADLLKDRLAHVNFIPYNPGEGIMGDDMKPTSPIIVKKFQDVLEKAGVTSTVRATMGDDIAAACGQLALKKEKHQSKKNTK